MSASMRIGILWPNVRRLSARQEVVNVGRIVQNDQVLYGGSKQENMGKEKTNNSNNNRLWIKNATLVLVADILVTYVAFLFGMVK